MDEIELKRHPETGELIPEEWKEIPNYNGYYEISNYGRVRSWKRIKWSKGKSDKPKILVQSLDSRGYLTVGLCDRGQKTRTVHRMVAEQFVDNPENKPQVNHKDGNKENNFYLNFEWTSQSENVKHAYNIGLKNKSGERNGRSKLTKEDVLEIRSLYETGNYTQKEIAQKFDVGCQHISSIITRKRWGHI